MAKRIRLLVSVFVVFAVTLSYISYVVNSYDDEPYRIVIDLSEEGTTSDSYVTLREVKGEVAYVNIEGEGNLLLEEGDKVELKGRQDIVNKYEGYVEVTNIEGDKVEFDIDVSFRLSFYVVHFVLVALLSGLFSLIVVNLVDLLETFVKTLRTNLTKRDNKNVVCIDDLRDRVRLAKKEDKNK